MRTEKYGMVRKNEKALCVVCLESVIRRMSSLTGHNKTNHKWFQKKVKTLDKEFIVYELKSTKLQKLLLLNL